MYTGALHRRADAEEREGGGTSDDGDDGISWAEMTNGNRAEISWATLQASDVECIHHQDPIHVAKRLKNNFDAVNRQLTFGNGAVATMAGLDALRVWGDETGGVDHGLAVKNTQQKDRQNWPSAQAILSRKVRHALWQHQSAVGGQEGLILYLDMAWRYTHIYFSRVITFEERIEHACYIIHFLRLWRAWIFLQEGCTVKDNFLTRETFVDTVMSCHSAILTILYYAIYLPDTPLHMDRIGTDSVEKYFSALGSWVVNKRDYNYLTMCRYLHKINWYAKTVTEGGVLAPEPKHHNDKPWRLEDLPCSCTCFGCMPSAQSAGVPPTFDPASIPSIRKKRSSASTQKKKASCPCPVAGCDNPDACKNDVVGRDITQEVIARIWTAAYYKAKAALELVGVKGSTNKKERTPACTSGKKSEGDGETLWHSPAALARWVKYRGWWSRKKHSDVMAGDEDEVGEDTDNRPDASLEDRYMVVPVAHFDVEGGSELVYPLEAESSSARIVAKITKFKQATAIRRPLPLFEAIVDHPAFDETTAYDFTVGQVVAYIQPVEYVPSPEQCVNLGYTHKDIGKQVVKDSEAELSAEATGTGIVDAAMGDVGEPDERDGAHVAGEKVNPLVTLPCGTEKYKSALVAEFNRCMDLGQKLSADRLLNVRDCARTEPSTRDEEDAVSNADRNYVKLKSYVVYEIQPDDGDDGVTCYIARVEKMKKSGGHSDIQYKKEVRLGGTAKEAGPTRPHFFPMVITAGSKGARNLWVQLKWMNMIRNSNGIFQLGGKGGDNEWYEAHHILGTINMR